MRYLGGKAHREPDPGPDPAPITFGEFPSELSGRLDARRDEWRRAFVLLAEHVADAHLGSRWFQRVAPTVARDVLDAHPEDQWRALGALVDMEQDVHPIGHPWLWEPKPGTGWPGYVRRVAGGWVTTGERRAGDVD